MLYSEILVGQTYNVYFNFYDYSQCLQYKNIEVSIIVLAKDENKDSIAAAVPRLEEFISTYDQKMLSDLEKKQFMILFLSANSFKEGLRVRY